jgi:hypothetical protein
MREPRVLDLGEMVEDDAPGLRELVKGRLPEPTASATPPSDEIAEANGRHEQFLARVAELSRVLTQDAAAVMRASRDGALLHTDEDWKRLAERADRDYDSGTFLLNRRAPKGCSTRRYQPCSCSCVATLWRPTDHRRRRPCSSIRR